MTTRDIKGLPALRIYGNYLPDDAPAALRITADQLAKLYDQPFPKSALENRGGSTKEEPR